MSRTELILSALLLFINGCLRPQATNSRVTVEKPIQWKVKGWPDAGKLLDLRGKQQDDYLVKLTHSVFRVYSFHGRNTIQCTGFYLETQDQPITSLKCLNGDHDSVAEIKYEPDTNFFHQILRQVKPYKRDWRNQVVSLRYRNSGEERVTFAKLPIGDPQSIKLFAPVWVPGYPFDEFRVSHGRVVGYIKNRRQYHALVYLPNSRVDTGAPVLNKKGQVVGIIRNRQGLKDLMLRNKQFQEAELLYWVTAIDRINSAVTGISPSPEPTEDPGQQTLFYQVEPNQKYGGNYQQFALGFKAEEIHNCWQRPLRGNRKIVACLYVGNNWVTDIEPGSIAQKAGLQLEDDIFSFRAHCQRQGQTEVVSFDHMKLAMLAEYPNQECPSIELGVFRNQQSIWLEKMIWPYK
jgi:hypothetical protein